MSGRGPRGRRRCGAGWIAGVALCGFIALQPAAGSAAPALSAVTSFEQLAAEADLVFVSPEGFDDVEPRANPLLSYERAIRHHTGALEVRYAVRPLGRVQIEYEDPHSSAPEPEHLFPMMFNSLIAQLSAGGHSPSREYPPEQARELFNADWAAASVFDVDPEFSRDYREGLLIALHRNGKADAYVVYLYNDYTAVKTLVDDTLSALSFSR